MIIDAPKTEHFPALKALWQEAFGDSNAYLESFQNTAFSPNRCRCITLDDGTIVAALYWFDCTYRGEHIAYLYAVATAKAYRGCGLCRALTENTHRHLKSLDYAGTLLVPGERSLFSFYEKLGYRHCSSISRLCCTASQASIKLRQIDVTEYTALRREFLPVGGVIQENENLAFLQTQASFYTGDGFLLTARDEAEALYGIELLGDTSAAPAILHALDYTKGSFRTPGKDIPFAMYHPLEESPTDPPSYFGLAFD